jgi:RNA polymerase-binding transcription factor DksA
VGQSEQTPQGRLAAEHERASAQVAQLEREFAAIVDSASGGASGGDDEHDPEGATVAFERQHVAALLDRARSHLSAIEAAKRKISAGTYEICDVCGDPIGKERLSARPASLTCVRCAQSRRSLTGLPARGHRLARGIDYLAEPASLFVGLGNETEGIRMRPAVMVGQHCTGLARPVSESTLADLAACNGKTRHRNREAPRG